MTWTYDLRPSFELDLWTISWRRRRTTLIAVVDKAKKNHDKGTFINFSNGTLSSES